jgi:hypothetical protein
MDILNTAGIVVVGMIIIGYLYMYIATRTYLRESYTDKKPACSKETTIPVEQAEPPYDLQPIRNLSEYEYGAIFENEAPKELSTQLRNKLMSQYPMDWSSNPPSSVNFQEGLKEMFEDKAAANQQPQPSMSPYTAIQDDSLRPPDTAAIESEERRLLQTYNPKSASELTTYNLDSAQELIKKIYDAKGEIPYVKKRDGNVYEIVGVRKKDEKIVYEETDPTMEVSDTMQGENIIEPPQAAADTNAALDPFYEPGTSTRQGRWNFRQWTPGLERMFPPTESRTNWY